MLKYFSLLAIASYILASWLAVSQNCAGWTDHALQTKGVIIKIAVYISAK